MPLNLKERKAAVNAFIVQWSHYGNISILIFSEYCIEELTDKDMISGLFGNKSIRVMLQ